MAALEPVLASVHPIELFKLDNSIGAGRELVFVYIKKPMCQFSNLVFLRALGYTGTSLDLCFLHIFMQLQPFLQGKTIDLRPLSPADAEGNYPQWFNDPEVCQYNSHHTYPYSREQALRYIADLQGSRRDVVLAIVTKGKTSRHIGNVSLQAIDYISRSAELAIILGEKSFWGKGIAREAAELIINHGFNALNLHRIYCGTSVKNMAMQKLAGALGMKEEGRRREALYKQGQHVDVIEYGLLREEWK